MLNTPPAQSLHRRPAHVQDAMATAASLESQTKALSNLSMHTQRLSRQFERTAAQLRELQKTRLTQEAKDMDSLLDIIEMHKSKGETYSPSEDGFVFSPAEITTATRARHRLASQARRQVSA
jgi:hypothetical protein